MILYLPFQDFFSNPGWHRRSLSLNHNRFLETTGALQYLLKSQSPNHHEVFLSDPAAGSTLRLRLHARQARSFDRRRDPTPLEPG
jgi:hypothetical protein